MRITLFFFFRDSSAHKNKEKERKKPRGTNVDRMRGPEWHIVNLTQVPRGVPFLTAELRQGFLSPVHHTRLKQCVSRMMGHRSHSFTGAECRELLRACRLRPKENPNASGHHRDQRGLWNGLGPLGRRQSTIRNEGLRTLPGTGGGKDSHADLRRAVHTMYAKDRGGRRMHISRCGLTGGRGR
ncbi:hypothetical protein LX36DRAFT_384693 [Colletotrichum falcatum]|nr:hypothetical protein LX36DRAFT_384693 [Colletotrichum falcatum]